MRQNTTVSEKAVELSKSLLHDLKTASKTVPRKDILASALKRIVEKEGKNVYEDTALLARCLEEESLPPTLIHQTVLAVCDGLLLRYITQEAARIGAVDINNMILAVEDAGLKQETARYVVDAILSSVNIPQTVLEYTDYDLTERDASNALYIPESAYHDRIKYLEDAVDNDSMDSYDWEDLATFVQAGIPRAYFVAGKAYYNGVGVVQDENKAIDYMKYAWSRGCVEASAALGAMYYGRDNQASYRFYSSPGGTALYRSDHARFIQLSKFPKISGRTLMLLVGVFFILEIFMLALYPASLSGQRHIAAAVICTLLNIVTLGGAVALHFANRFRDLRFGMLGYLMSFFIYLICLL